MKTQINGKDADWTPKVYTLWDQKMAGIDDPRPVTLANYFTPRPYVDQYNRGSDHAGFTYTRGRDVYQVTWTPEKDQAV